MKAFENLNLWPKRLSSSRPFIDISLDDQKIPRHAKKSSISLSFIDPQSILGVQTKVRIGITDKVCDFPIISWEHRIL